MRFWFHLLAALFVFRVLAQLLQSVFDIPFLPSFDAWHGGVLPYPVLLASQVVIVVVLYAIIWRAGTHAMVPRRWKYRVCFALGGIYFSFMAFRLLAGLTFLAGNPWFSKGLPAFFHLVLAGFVLVLGWHIYGLVKTQTAVRERLHKTPQQDDG